MTPPSITIEDHETVSYSLDLTTIFYDEDTNQTLSYFYTTVPNYLSADIVGTQLSVSRNSDGSEVNC